MRGNDIRFAGTRFCCGSSEAACVGCVEEAQHVPGLAYAAVCLRACYSMPGSATGHASDCLRVCCAMPGAE
eukprot:133038-Rhodomonas_salina.2